MLFELKVLNESQDGGFTFPEYTIPGTYNFVVHVSLIDLVYHYNFIITRLS